MLNGILNALSAQFKGDNTQVQSRVTNNNTGKNDFAQLLADQDRKMAAPAPEVLAQIEPGSSVQKSAVEQFLEYQNMNMAEKVRASYLSAKGLTEEDIAALTPQERLKIEEDIKAEIKRKLDPAQV